MTHKHKWQHADKLGYEINYSEKTITFARIKYINLICDCGKTKTVELK